MYTIRPVMDGWYSKEWIALSRSILMVYFYDSANRLREIRIKNTGSDKYWTPEQQAELDEMVRAGRLKLDKNLYYK